MSLLKNTSIYTLGALLPKIGSFVFLPIYLQYLTEGEYGIISSLFVLNVVFVVVFSWALPRAIFRIYYDYKTIEDRHKLLGTIIISVFILAVFFLGIIFIFQDQVQRIYRSINFYPFFFYSILIAFAQAFLEIPNILLQVKEKVKMFVVLNVNLFMMKSFLILWFVTKLKLGAQGYLQAELISLSIFIPVFYITIRKNIKLTWEFQIFRNIVLFSIPMIPSILSSWILNLSDRIFIEQYFTQEEVGVYSLGYQIAGLVLIVAGSFKQAYDPYFYKIANNLPLEMGKNQLQETNFVFLLMMMFGCFAIALFADDGIRLFFDQGYHEAIIIVPIIALAYLISQNSALLNVMMYQVKKTKIIMYITILSSGFNIILNYLLIPRIGIYGAAWSTVISFVLVFILSYNQAKKAYFIPYNWGRLLSVFVLFLGVFFLFYYLKITNIWISLLYKTIIILSLGGIIFLRHKSVFKKIIKF